MTVCALPMNRLIVFVWLPRIWSVSLVSRSAGCARRSTAERSPGPAREARAELADDQAETFAVGAPHDVVDEVDRRSSSWSA